MRPNVTPNKPVNEQQQYIKYLFVGMTVGGHECHTPSGYAPDHRTHFQKAPTHIPICSIGNAMSRCALQVGGSKASGQWQAGSTPGLQLIQMLAPSTIVSLLIPR